MEAEFDLAKDWAAQMEVGDSGTPHIQGCIKYKLQKDMGYMKQKYPRAHLEVCRKWDESVQYCGKADSRAEGGTTWTSATHYAAGLWDPLAGKELYPWQRHLVSKMEDYTPEMRSIYWYWEDVGNTGKSSFCKHIQIDGAFNSVYVYGKTADVACLLAKKREVAKSPKDMPSIIFYDCPRTGVVNYHMLEMIKNGLFMSGKYESSTVTMNPPFIVVLANFPPIPRQLSADRLKVYKIDKHYRAKPDRTWNDESNYFNPPTKKKRGNPGGCGGGGD